MQTAFALSLDSFAATAILGWSGMDRRSWLPMALGFGFWDMFGSALAPLPGCWVLLPYLFLIGILLMRWRALLLPIALCTDNFLLPGASPDNAILAGIVSAGMAWLGFYLGSRAGRRVVV